MRGQQLGLLIAVVCSGLSAVSAQQPQHTQSSQQPAPGSINLATANTATQNNISAKLGTYVFPKNGQSASKQNSDESYCYNWAKSQTNFDPMNAAPPPQAASNAPQPTGQETAPRRGAT